MHSLHHSLPVLTTHPASGPFPADHSSSLPCPALYSLQQHRVLLPFSFLLNQCRRLFLPGSLKRNPGRRLCGRCRAGMRRAGPVAAPNPRLAGGRTSSSQALAADPPLIVELLQPSDPARSPRAGATRGLSSGAAGAPRRYRSLTAPPSTALLQIKSSRMQATAVHSFSQAVAAAPCRRPFAAASAAPARRGLVVRAGMAAQVRTCRT